MARQEVLVDDIDGAPGAVTVPFTVEKYAYEIDLTPDHRRELYAVLEPYMEAGRQILPEPVVDAKPARRTQPRIDPEQLESIRAWARRNGYRVADRGRVPAAVLDAYQAAHSGLAPEPEPQTA